MKIRIAEIVSLAVEKLLPVGAVFPEISIEIPKKEGYGDFSTNAAMLLAKQLKRPPQEIAESIAREIKKQGKEPSLFDKIEAAPNGFINFTLRLEFLQENIRTIRKKGSNYGKSNFGAGKKALIEFVSANPTGPLHVGHGRWAVIGDDVASLLEATGYCVEREYYVNDVGNQINLLEESVKAVGQNKPIPANGYGGAYVKEIAKKLKGKTRLPGFRDLLLSSILDQQKATLNKLGVKFNNFFSEKSLHQEGVIEEVISKLSAAGHAFRESGALWFKSSVFGDDKNRVLVKETGETTYFAADIAYHLNKFNRGFDVMIDVWGADHHGYVPRLKAALQALELPLGRFEFIIGQLVTLYRGTEPVRMSKRTGDMVTLDEVLAEIGADAVRFFMTMTSANNHLDFDLNLAKEKNLENPVYYIQYAHARISSILRKAKRLTSKTELSSLTHESERLLMRRLLDLEDEIIAAARKREPHHLVNYVKDLAALFHNFYHKLRVLENPARLHLVDATRIVIKNVLNLLKISAPERM